MNVAIVGCGSIGYKRVAALHALGEDRLLVVADTIAERAMKLATATGSRWSTEWKNVVEDDQIDIVVVSTTNQYLCPITVGALHNGKHVLCEKPLGRNVAEASQMVETARSSHRLLKTGFNHRHHPAIRTAHSAAASGELGTLMFIRSIYGHGGRLGYEKEWRGDRIQAGGGEMLDQGVHVLDLCRWFLGEFSQVSGITRRYFWQIGSLEDNAFALLQTSGGKVASLHTSWTQWKNRFSFEIFGEAGYARVEGLGGSYGDETLTVGKRRSEFGAPVEERFVYHGEDESWKEEWREFKKAIECGTVPLGSGEDGLAIAQLVEAIYRSSSAGGTSVPVTSHHTEGSITCQK
ncbi:MAG: Gfo/Idh/MocA family oxidoreductase [Acidobacteria bacterium]|nr:Gfo/Idh/MocA family oxidoreductase [Acidobacteriota bacterium]